MPEYIERDALRTELLKISVDTGNLWGCGVLEGLERATRRVNNAPAADVAPVVHGEWIEKPFLLGTSNFCSLCDSFYGMPHGKYNYCPNCGAKMDGGADRGKTL